MTSAEMIDQNTQYGDAWTAEQIALVALEEGNTYLAADFAQIHAETYGEVDPRLARLI